jgi:hypothetical protein
MCTLVGSGPSSATIFSSGYLRPQTSEPANEACRGGARRRVERLSK